MPEAKADSQPPGHYTPANGLQVYAETYGSGPALLCLHGSLGTGQVWKPFVPLLSPHFKLILPDARGHGRTANPAGQLSMPIMADDVAALIEALGLKSPCLCGWSMGGDVALQVARRYPERVGRLIVGGVTHRLSDTYTASLKAMGLDGPGQIDFERAKQNIPQLIAQWQAVHAQTPSHWKDLALQLSGEMLNPTLPSEADLKRIAAPTLIVWGDRDQFLPLENAVELYRLLPQAQLAVVPKADHFVTRTHVEHFAALVKSFLLS